MTVFSGRFSNFWPLSSDCFVRRSKSPLSNACAREDASLGFLFSNFEMRE